MAFLIFPLFGVLELFRQGVRVRLRKEARLPVLCKWRKAHREREVERENRLDTLTSGTFSRRSVLERAFSEGEN